MYVCMYVCIYVCMYDELLFWDAFDLRTTDSRISIKAIVRKLHHRVVVGIDPDLENGW